MAEFIIQSNKLDNGNFLPAHDFGYSVIEAVQYEKWIYNGNSRHGFKLTSLSSFKPIRDEVNIYPVGSVEFVLDYFKFCHGIENIAPINIPPQLDQFTNRKIERVYNLRSLTTSEPQFIKSMTKIKGHSEIVEGTREFPYDHYLVSDMLDIKAEWRCFVYRGKLLDAKCYSYTDSPFCAPDLYVIHDMISAYKPSPTAYTLDVCVDSSGRTSIIEVHNFFSCGLYGFNDYGNYLQMLIAAIRWQIEQSKPK